jgi:AcrR family transcriptional regulator
MSEITAEAGGSKATVYNYFSSKEELFVECMTSITDRYLEGTFKGLKDPEAEISVALLDIAKNHLRVLCSQEMLASKRLLITEAERSGIGRLFYKKMDSYMEKLGEFLRRGMDEGHLRQGDPFIAAHQLKALVEADIVERCLMGAHKIPLTAAAITRAAQNAVTTFFRAYALEGDGESQVVKPAPDMARARKSGLKKTMKPLSSAA